MHISSSYQPIAPCEDNLKETYIRMAPTCELVIQIADSGSGIAADQIDKIFEPFISYHSGGIGLGLSIVRQILKLHHAGIEVNSTVNKGSLFTLTFPCVDNHDEKENQSTHR